VPNPKGREGRKGKGKDEEGKGKVMGRGICLLLNLGLGTPLYVTPKSPKGWLRNGTSLFYE